MSTKRPVAEIDDSSARSKMARARLANPAFTLEKLDGVIVFTPALAQDLDGHDATGLRFLGPVDPAEAA